MLDRTLVRIPSLDGLRAISITLVIVGHVLGDYKIPFIGSFGLAVLGVRVFFVISGYLITKILLREMEALGRVGLPRFYLRRTLRLFPAFLAYALVIIVLAHFDVVALKSGDVLAAFTYTMNYHRDRAWSLGHFWSLAVEEQFYFVWPALLAALGAARGIRFAALYVLAAPLIRIGSWFVFPESRDGIGETFPTTADAIAIGCVLAGVRPWLEQVPAYLRFQKSWAFLLVPIVAVLSTRLVSHPMPDMLGGQTLANVCVAMIIDWCVRFPEGGVGRLLNAQPLVVIGVGSYSLYLWQQLFLDPRAHHWFNAFPVNVILASLMAVGSYRLIEQPVMSMRSRSEELRMRAREPTIPPPE